VDGKISSHRPLRFRLYNKALDLIIVTESAAFMLIPPTILPILTAAGWHPGRHVTVSNAIPPSHPATAVLSVFGGMKAVPIAREGVECATSSLSFQELDAYFNARVQPWNSLLRTELMGIAQVEDGHGLLYVAADGRCFGMSDIHDAFYYEGCSIEEAIERMLLGYRARPMLRPDQASVTLYGDTFVAGDAALYDYRLPST
jgi:hypothetical protein